MLLGKFQQQNFNIYNASVCQNLSKFVGEKIWFLHLFAILRFFRKILSSSSSSYMGDNWAWHTSPWYNSSVVGSPVSTPILTVTTALFSSAIIAYFYLAKESWTCTVKFYINWGRRRQQHFIGKMNIFLGYFATFFTILQILREFLSNIFVPALTMRGWMYSVVSTQ